MKEQRILLFFLGLTCLAASSLYSFFGIRSTVHGHVRMWKSRNGEMIPPNSAHGEKMSPCASLSVPLRECRFNPNISEGERCYWGSWKSSSLSVKKRSARMLTSTAFRTPNLLARFQKTRLWKTGGYIKGYTFFF